VAARAPDIPFTRRTPARSELAYVREAIESGRVSGDGPFTARASAALEALLGAPVLLTTSCTHALELAALLLDLGPGDEVVLPSYTFSSTANAFALRGARLRFADVDPGTFSMERAQLEAAITPATTAVCAVPYGGVMRDPAGVAELCAARSLALVEDAAQGLFATVDARPLGTFGRLGALSFHATKNVSCGEGGALIAGDRSLLARATTLREKGTDRTRFLRGEVDKYTWQEVGSSYLPSDVLAAMLLAQLEDAESTQAARHAAWAVYRQALAPVAAARGIQLQEIPPGVRHPAHLFALALPESIDRDAVIAGLRERGIQAVSHFEPLHRAPSRAGSDAPEPLPVTDDLARGVIRLPLYNDMTEADAERVVAALIATLEALP
jgi:dTDP-4-amino-4,6-dideoxygalactose transaminase